MLSISAQRVERCLLELPDPLSGDAFLVPNLLQSPLPAVGQTKSASQNCSFSGTPPIQCGVHHHPHIVVLDQLIEQLRSV